MKNKSYKTLKIIALVFFVFTMLFPILYALSTSFMTTAEIESFPAKLLPTKITFDNYKDAFRIQPIMHYVKNSFIFDMRTQTMSLGYNFVSFDNYKKVFQDEYFLRTLKWTLEFTIISVFFEIIIATGLALLMNKKIRGQGFISLLFCFLGLFL